MTQNKILVGIVAILFIGMMSMFTVNQSEKAIKFRLGQIVKSDYEPGLYFKIPLINKVKLFDARIQTMDSKPERFLTAEKKNVIVDSFVKWRIGDVTKFYTVVAGDIDQANLRLDQIIKDAFRSEFSMEAERERVAREFRSQGSEAAERIRADADRQRVVTLANAYRDAETLRGEGDAKSAEIYAQTYGQNPEFFSFYRSLNAYKKTMSNNSTVVIEPNSEFFQYFKNDK